MGAEGKHVPVKTRLLGFPSGGAPFGRVILFPPSFVRLLQPRDSQIMVAELIACIVSVFEFPELFEHKAITFHLDNTSALMALNKGSSRAPDLAHLSMSAHACFTVLKAVPWLEHIGSQSNIADGGAREGGSDAWATLSRIPVRPVHFGSRAAAKTLGEEWDERQRQETTLKHESWTWSSNQTGPPKQSPEPGVASARSDECDSGIEDDCIQTNPDATVRPVSLPEGWTVVLNSLRGKLSTAIVKSGIACFQMPENPELLNDLKFENGSGSGSGDLSQKRRSDGKRNLSNHPEHNKLKISCGDHPQRSPQYVENQVMVKSPSYWTDPFQAKLDKRRTTKITRTAEPLSRDVIELKQDALWHGGKIRIDQASAAAAEGMVRQPKVPRISFRSEGISSVIHQERAISSQTSHPPSWSSGVELPQMSGGTCREQSSTNASGSSMCGSDCVSRLERATGSSRKISRRKGNFLVAPIPVADIPRCHSFCRPVDV